MTGPREAGVLLGQARQREFHRKSSTDREVLAFERIAEALEGIEVSLAVLADAVEASVYEDGEEYEADS